MRPQRLTRVQRVGLVQDNGWRKLDDIIGGPHEFGCCSICFTSAGKVVLGLDWTRIPWERTIKTGGVRVTIAEIDWLNHRLERQK